MGGSLRADETTSPRMKSFLRTRVIECLDQQLHSGHACRLRTKLDGSAGRAVFDYPKRHRRPEHVDRCDHPRRPDAVILDFFAGSGSTGHAVMDLNAADGGHRRFIIVQLDEARRKSDCPNGRVTTTIADLARERLRRAGAQVDAGSRTAGRRSRRRLPVLKVDTTNMADVLATA